MPGFRLLDSIDGKRPNGVDRQLVEFVGHVLQLPFLHAGY
jgi:hypothetical protein